MPLLFVVDDNADLCRMMERMLSRFGYAVRTFTSGTQLLEHLLAADALPDLLILDYMMPEMDGCELLARIRVNPRTGGIPAVFYTAVDDEHVFQRMRDCGADDYWIKSRIDAAAIENGVRRILQLRGAGERRAQFFFNTDERPRVNEAPQDRT
jgi:CheY-like chemotaxis protein